MAREFIAEAANPQDIFDQIQQWAASNGFRLTGTVAGGSFSGTPGGMAGYLYGQISGTYAVTGNRVRIMVDKDLPTGAVSERLARFGLRLVSSR